jgi:hypothetical protein
MTDKAISPPASPGAPTARAVSFFDPYQTTCRLWFASNRRCISRAVL